jgi:hypothetical protein
MNNDRLIARVASERIGFGSTCHSGAGQPERLVLEQHNHAMLNSA